MINRNKVYYYAKHYRAISASLGSILPCLPLPLTTLLVNIIIIVNIPMVNIIIVNIIIVKIIVVNIIIVINKIANIGNIIIVVDFIQFHYTHHGTGWYLVVLG